MLPKIRKALTEKIVERMEKEGLNWETIQKANIKAITTSIREYNPTFTRSLFY